MIITQLEAVALIISLDPEVGPTHRPCSPWHEERSSRAEIWGPQTFGTKMGRFVVRDLGPSVMFCGRKHVVTGRFVATNHTGFDVDRLHSVT